jgi:hypothetical protein
MYWYGLPLGCLLLVLALAAAYVSLSLGDGPAEWAALGAAALLAYAGIMSIHAFERSRAPA